MLPENGVVHAQELLSKLYSRLMLGSVDLARFMGTRATLSFVLPAFPRKGFGAIVFQQPHTFRSLTDEKCSTSTTLRQSIVA